MTDLNLKCPCKDCICIPVCRHKSYNVLFMDCELLNDYEPSYKSMYARDENRITIVLEILKPIEKAIITLNLEGCSNKEIAEIIGITPTNVSTRIYRIKNKLKNHLIT